MELSDLQCAQKWCHAHQEDIAQMPEFARDIQSVDDEEVSRSLRGSSLILSPAVMLALNMYRANGYEIVNCQIFQHWINEYESDADESEDTFATSLGKKPAVPSASM